MEGCRSVPKQANRERLLFYSTPYNEDIFHQIGGMRHQIDPNGEVSQSFEQLGIGKKYQRTNIL